MSMGAVVTVGSNEAYAFSKPVREQIMLLAGVGVEGDAHAGTTVKHRSRVRADPSQPNLRQVHLLAAELFDELLAQGYEVTPGQLGENVTTRGVDLLRLPRGTILRFGRAPRRPVETGPDGAAGLSGVFAAAHRATLSAETAAAVAAVTAAAERDGGIPPKRHGAEDGPGGYGAEEGPVGYGAEDGPVGHDVMDGPAGGRRVRRRDGDRGQLDSRPAVIVAGLRNPCAQINGLHPGLLRCVLSRDDAGNPVRKAGVMGVVLRGGPIRPGDPITVELPPGPRLPLERV